jgi:nucleoside-diphosphate-sugar epimerase
MRPLPIAARPGGDAVASAGDPGGKQAGGMRVVIAGGHGKIALLLERLLAGRGDQAVGLSRNPAQVAGVHKAGAEAVVCDLEAAPAEDVAALLSGADAVVFAAGAGPGSGAPRKDTVDRAGSVLVAGAAGRAGVRRFVQVSSMGAASRRARAAARSGPPASRPRPPPGPICAPGTWTGPSCARAA